VGKRDVLDDALRPDRLDVGNSHEKKDSPNEPSLVNGILDLAIALCAGNDVDPTTFPVKHDVTLDQSIQSVVVALANVKARMKAVANLSD